MAATPIHASIDGIDENESLGDLKVLDARLVNYFAQDFAMTSMENVDKTILFRLSDIVALLDKSFVKQIAPQRGLYCTKARKVLHAGIEGLFEKIEVMSGLNNEFLEAYARVTDIPKVVERPYYAGLNSASQDESLVSVEQLQQKCVVSVLPMEHTINNLILEVITSYVDQHSAHRMFNPAPHQSVTDIGIRYLAPDHEWRLWRENERAADSQDIVIPLIEGSFKKLIRGLDEFLTESQWHAYHVKRIGQFIRLERGSQDIRHYMFNKVFAGHIKR